MTVHKKSRQTRVKGKLVFDQGMLQKYVIKQSEIYSELLVDLTEISRYILIETTFLFQELSCFVILFYGLLLQYAFIKTDVCINLKLD